MGEGAVREWEKAGGGGREEKAKAEGKKEVHGGMVGEEAHISFNEKMAI